jgi:hypothetical protein
MAGVNHLDWDYIFIGDICAAVAAECVPLRHASVPANYKWSNASCDRGGVILGWDYLWAPVHAQV